MESSTIKTQEATEAVLTDVDQASYGETPIGSFASCWTTSTQSIAWC